MPKYSVTYYGPDITKPNTTQMFNMEVEADHHIGAIEQLRGVPGIDGTQGTVTVKLIEEKPRHVVAEARVVDGTLVDDCWRDDSIKADQQELRRLRDEVRRERSHTDRERKILVMERENWEKERKKLVDYNHKLSNTNRELRTELDKANECVSEHALTAAATESLYKSAKNEVELLKRQLDLVRRDHYTIEIQLGGAQVEVDELKEQIRRIEESEGI